MTAPYCFEMLVLILAVKITNNETFFLTLFKGW